VPIPPNSPSTSIPTRVSLEPAVVATVQKRFKDLGGRTRPRSQRNTTAQIAPSRQGTDPAMLQPRAEVLNPTPGPEIIRLGLPRSGAEMKNTFPFRGRERDPSSARNAFQYNHAIADAYAATQER